MLGKIILYIIAILALCGSVLLRYSDNPLGDKYDESKYVTGGYNRKQVVIFGIRRFEIFRLTDDMEKNTKRWSLYDNQGSGTIECNVYSYTDLSPYVYTFGEEGYTKLNYETAEVLQTENLNEFSSEDQNIFKNLEEGKLGVKNEQSEKWGAENG